MIRILFVRDFAPERGLVYSAVITLDAFVLFRNTIRLFGDRRRHGSFTCCLFGGGSVAAAKNWQRMLERTCSTRDAALKRGPAYITFVGWEARERRILVHERGSRHLNRSMNRF